VCGSNFLWPRLLERCGKPGNLLSAPLTLKSGTGIRNHLRLQYSKKIIETTSHRSRKLHALHRPHTDPRLLPSIAACLLSTLVHRLLRRQLLLRLLEFHPLFHSRIANRFCTFRSQSFVGQDSPRGRSRSFRSVVLDRNSITSEFKGTTESKGVLPF
jgi:hypothetical protein